MQSRFNVRRWLSFLLMSGLILFLACATVPLTGRQQINLIPSDQLLTMSYQQYDDVKKQSKLITSGPQLEQIKTVGARVSQAAEEFLRESGVQMAFQWEFVLIDDPKMVNAWCMPGGKVAFYTGILPLTQDATGVAVVMGHEVAHALAQHGNERMSQGLLVELGGITLAKALEQKPETTRNLWLQAFGLGAQIGFMLPYSRKHESEADRIGLVIMAKAGYDPNLSVPFWERMSQLGGQAPPEFLSTHPANTTRIADLKKHLPEAMKYYRPR
ncbi:M48 family metallopeptidase [candidate division KSB1 bacterium]|nr:M48 family metallopeptidase [candidate division KSB1 bacterium]